MDFLKVLQTTLLIGKELPAYKALFDQVVDLFDKPQQEKLKEEYAKSVALAEDAHKAAQKD